MADLPGMIKWYVMDEAAAKALTTVTSSPGTVYPLNTTALPERLKGITGVASYYVSGYVSTQALTQGITVGGEMLVARVDNGTTKNYNFVFATSSNGIAFYTGPFKGFGHHVVEGQSTHVSSLFGNTPFSKLRGS
jgi:hypothetical protein